MGPAGGGVLGGVVILGWFRGGERLLVAKKRVNGCRVYRRDEKRKKSRGGGVELGRLVLRLVG